MYNNVSKAAKGSEKNTKKRLLKETMRRVKKGNIGDNFYKKMMLNDEKK